MEGSTAKRKRRKLRAYAPTGGIDALDHRRLYLRMQEVPEFLMRVTGCHVGEQLIRDWVNHGCPSASGKVDANGKPLRYYLRAVWVGRSRCVCKRDLLRLIDHDDADLSTAPKGRGKNWTWQREQRKGGRQ